MYNFLTFNDLKSQDISPEVILGRLSEAGQCLLTGNSNELVYLPVDGDTTNMLPSNMICLAKDICSGFTCNFVYEIPLGNFFVVFDTPFELRTYNEVALEQVSTRHSEELEAITKKPSGEKLISLFELLTARHAKGIMKIREESLSLDRIQFQSYVLRMLSKKKSSIISLT